MLPGLEHLRTLPGGTEWLDRLPRLVEECVERWQLDLGPPLLGGYCSFVAPAGAAVLKIGFPHEESEHEPHALHAWNGNGAVRLLDHDEERGALLIERCVPGAPLLERDEDEAADVVAGLLPRLWIPPPSELRLLADVAERWVEELPQLWAHYGRPFERELLDAAVAALRDLGPTQGPLVLANEDLNAGNVLRAEREPWLVIDPKPIAAEREFTPVAMIRDEKEELPRLRRRLDSFSSDLELDRERVRGWTIAHTLAWGFEKPSGFHAAHAEMARLVLAA